MKVLRRVIGTSSLIFAFFLLFSGMTGYLLISSEPDNTSLIEEVQAEFQKDKNSRQEKINNASYDEEVNFATGSEVAEARQHYESTISDYGIGYIYMPSSGIAIPLLAGTSEWNLMNGVGTDRPDQELGEGLFVGLSHNMMNKTLLQPIDQMQAGDYVYVTDFESVYVYQVLRQELAHETDGKFFNEPGEEDSAKLLLYRCEGGYGTDWRRSLYSEFIEEKSFDEVDQSVLDGLQISQVEVEDDSEQTDSEQTEEVNEEKSVGEDLDQAVEQSGWVNRIKRIFSPVTKGLVWVRDQIASLIRRSSFLRDYFLGTYSLIDGNNLMFALMVILLFAMYGIL